MSDSKKLQIFGTIMSPEVITQAVADALIAFGMAPVVLDNDCSVLIDSDEAILIIE